jgi:preprotein translocase SecE subunit
VGENVLAEKKPVKRIKLDSKSSPKKTAKKSVTKKTVTKPKASPKKVVRVATLPLTGTWGYIANSWNELRQVRWPNRAATWSLTLAVIAFTVFFTIIILALDAGFQYLFKEVLLK